MPERDPSEHGMDFTNLTQSLADLNVTTIVWFAVILTVVRLVFIRIPGGLARAIVEMVEAALIAGVLVFMVIQPFVVKAFYIPSGSMLPTLVDNDHILVSRFTYRMHGPHHGDVVVFLAPPQALALEQAPGDPLPTGPIDYIKRCIGLPGDTLSVVGGTITINGQIYTHSFVRQFFNLSNDYESKDSQHIKFAKDGVWIYDGKSWTEYPPSEVARRINGSPNAHITISPGYVVRDGVRLDEPYIAEDPDYNLKVTRDGQVLLTDSEGDTRLIGDDDADAAELAKLEREPVGKIPANDVVVMGDNRNDSNDSSQWGPLSEDRLVGKAFFIFFPFNRIQRIK
jgi:signal peptidase I